MTMQQLAPNTVLKGSWVIDKKLGEGACAVVYSVKPTGPNTSSPVVDYVAKVVTAPVGKGAALKQKTVLYNLLYHEYMLHTGHFKGFSLSPQFPALPRFMYGEEEHTNVGRVRFLVMERLRFDLHSYIASLSDSGVQQVISSSSSNKIKGKAAATISTKLHSIVSYLGLQIMAGLQEIHSKGFVFVDVKPDNFMVNPNPTNPNQPRLYFIDFALAERYTAATSGSFHRANIPCAVPKGTPGYMSVSCQEGALPSRRDDIEAAVWVLLSLLLPAQELPWANSTSPAECLRLKKSCDIAALCVKYNCKELASLMQLARSLEYEGTPDYARYTELLQALSTGNRDSHLSSTTEPSTQGQAHNEPKATVTAARGRGKGKGKTSPPLEEQEDEEAVLPVAPLPEPTVKSRGKRVVPASSSAKVLSTQVTASAAAAAVAVGAIDLTESGGSPSPSLSPPKNVRPTAASLRRLRAAEAKTTTEATTTTTTVVSPRSRAKRRRSVEAPFQLL